MRLTFPKDFNFYISHEGTSSRKFCQEEHEEYKRGSIILYHFSALTLAQGTDVLLIAAGIGREYGGGGV
jgi:hypothetical protein